MKIKHILKSKEFGEILKNGSKTHGKKISLYVKKEDDGEDISVGIVISRRFVRRAVTRNYLRRLIYAYFRNHEDSLKSGIRVIVRVNGKLEGLGKKSLSGEIRKTLEELVIRKGIKR